MDLLKKFKVIKLYDAHKIGAIELEDWLNERHDRGQELVAIFEDKFIFKNTFYTTIKTIENYLEK